VPTLALGGRFDAICRDRFRRVRWIASFHNGVTLGGLDRLLGVGFKAAAAISPFVGLISQSGYTGLSPSDTHDSHPGWGEWTSYGGNRPAWVPQAAAGGVMASLVPFQYVMTAGGQLRGAFIASQAAKGSNPGPVVYCTAAAGSALAVVATDVVTCTYALTLRE
jgi:hypothetical protein